MLKIVTPFCFGAGIKPRALSAGKYFAKWASSLEWLSYLMNYFSPFFLFLENSQVSLCSTLWFPECWDYKHVPVTKHCSHLGQSHLLFRDCHASQLPQEGTGQPTEAGRETRHKLTVSWALETKGKAGSKWRRVTEVMENSSKEHLAYVPIGTEGRR